MAVVAFPTQLFDDVNRHLSRAPESIAFMRSAEPGEDRVFRVNDLFLIDTSDAGIVGDHCELNDELRASIIKWAWDEGGCLLEAHSHGLLFPPVRFSRFDLEQFREWVPHVRWRLGGRPYVALVTASREMDGLAWIDSDPEGVTSVEVDGREAITTSGLSLPLWEGSRNDT